MKGEEWLYLLDELLGMMKGESCHRGSDHRRPNGSVGSWVTQAATRTCRALPPIPIPFESVVSSSVEVGAEKAPARPSWWLQTKHLER